MKLAELQTQVKKNALSSVYLVSGNQPFLIDLTLSTFKKIIPKDNLDMDWVVYDAEIQSVDDAIADASTFSFFGGKKVVVVKNANFLTAQDKTKQNVDHLLAYVERPETQSILVLVVQSDNLDKRKKITKLLAKETIHLDFSNFSVQQVSQFAKQTIQKDGYQIDEETLSNLVLRSDQDLSTVMKNIEILEIYVEDSKIITIDNVVSLIPSTLTASALDLVDRIARRDVSGATTIFNQLVLDGQSPVSISALLISQFRLLLQVKILFENGLREKEIATKIKQHPYRVKLALQTISYFSLSKLSNSFVNLVNMDYRLKSSTQDPSLLFELFISELMFN